MKEAADDNDKNVRGWVARAIGYSFEKLPRDYRKLLFILSENEATRVKTAITIVVGRNFEEI